MRERIAQGLAALNLSPAAADPLTRYGQLLLEKNKVVNLTAITLPQEVATHHMLDCATLLTRLDLAGKSLIDVGTGAGFPGLVLKILEPSLQLTLLDPLQKRLDFLAEVCQALELEGVTLVHGRGEELGHAPSLREGFDVATARAVAALSVLGELTLPFVKIGGMLVAMKGVDSGEELSAATSGLALLGGGPPVHWDYTIPTTQVAHRLVTVEKHSPTPEKYPRRWAKLSKHPL